MDTKIWNQHACCRPSLQWASQSTEQIIFFQFRSHPMRQTEEKRMSKWTHKLNKITNQVEWMSRLNTHGFVPKWSHMPSNRRNRNANGGWPWWLFPVTNCPARDNSSTDLSLMINICTRKNENLLLTSTLCKIVKINLSGSPLQNSESLWKTKFLQGQPLQKFFTNRKWFFPLNISYPSY